MTVQGTLSGTGNANRAVVLQANPFPFTAGFQNVGNPRADERDRRLLLPGARPDGRRRSSASSRPTNPPVVSPVATENVAVRVDQPRRAHQAARLRAHLRHGHAGRGRRAGGRSCGSPHGQRRARRRHGAAAAATRRARSSAASCACAKASTACSCGSPPARGVELRPAAADPLRPAAADPLSRVSAAARGGGAHRLIDRQRGAGRRSGPARRRPFPRRRPRPAPRRAAAAAFRARSRGAGSARCPRRAA